MEQTLGAKRVRTSFNPRSNTPVDVLKQDTARLINSIENFVNHQASVINASTDAEFEYLDEIQRIAQMAMDQYEMACMLAVKMATTSLVDTNSVTSSPTNA
jgi:hypothetical protein